MEWMILPLKRYADFSGRSRRLEFWMFTLFLVLAITGAIVLFAIFAALTESTGALTTSTIGTILLIIVILAYLAILIPSIAVQVRRFHDQNLSGWMVLLGFVPYVGGLIVLVFMCIDGTPGPNRYGPDPKGRGDNLSEVFI